MSKLYRIINMVLIFMLMGVFLCQNLVCAKEIVYLRTPVGTSYGRTKDAFSELELELIRARLKKQEEILKNAPLVTKLQSKFPGTIRKLDLDKHIRVVMWPLNNEKRIKDDIGSDMELSVKLSLRDPGLRKKLNRFIELPAQRLVIDILQFDGRPLWSNAYGPYLNGVIWEDVDRKRYFTPLSERDYLYNSTQLVDEYLLTGEYLRRLMHQVFTFAYKGNEEIQIPEVTERLIRAKLEVDIRNNAKNNRFFWTRRGIYNAVLSLKEKFSDINKNYNIKLEDFILGNGDKSNATVAFSFHLIGSRKDFLVIRKNFSEVTDREIDTFKKIGFNVELKIKPNQDKLYIEFDVWLIDSRHFGEVVYTKKFAIKMFGKPREWRSNLHKITKEIAEVLIKNNKLDYRLIKIYEEEFGIDISDFIKTTGLVTEDLGRQFINHML